MLHCKTKCTSWITIYIIDWVNYVLLKKKQFAIKLKILYET